MALVTKDNQLFLAEKMPENCPHRFPNEKYFGVFLRCAQAAKTTPFFYCQMDECDLKVICNSIYPIPPF